MNDILIVGGGGHAKVVAALLKKHTDWNPIGYTDPDDNGPLLTLPYLGADNVIPSLRAEKYLKYAVAGIGLVGSTEYRFEVIMKIKNMGLSFTSIASPQSIVNEEVQLGDGSIIIDGAVLQPGVTIGSYSIVNTGALLDHDCIIGDHVHIAPGVTLSGEVELGNHVLVGTGASILQGMKIADHVIIGSGAIVVSDLENAGTYVGVPAKLKTL